MIREVRREEQDDENLAEFRRLHRKRPEHEPVAAAADLCAEENGQEEHDDAADSRDVRVVDEPDDAAPEADDEEHQDHRDEQPAQLRYEQCGL